jgi:hypothetical protein
MLRLRSSWVGYTRKLCSGWPGAVSYLLTASGAIGASVPVSCVHGLGYNQLARSPAAQYQMEMQTNDEQTVSTRLFVARETESRA